MNTLQGIIARSVDNANTQFETLGYIGTNTSNYNTVGYKAQRFENYFFTNGRLEGVLRTDYSTGAMLLTRRPLDVALDGPGFIPITDKKGNISYTRDGSFSINTEGYLVAYDNSIVGDGIKIPLDYEKIKISPEGEVKVIPKGEIEEQTVGKIPVVRFSNPEGLKQLDGNRLEATSNSGDPILISADYIKQGTLERSNTSVQETVNDILRLNGSLISSTKLIKVIDEFYRQSINLRQ